MKFGTDGVRGPAGQWPIDTDGAARIGAAAVRLGGGGATRVVVGRDTRPSGPGLAQAVCDAIVSAGGVAIDAEVVPTPAVAWAVHTERADVGVMITASHNAAPDNGFKLFAEGGRKPTADETRQIEAWLAEPSVNRPGGEATSDRALVADYAAALGTLASVDLSSRSIAVDCANGAATPLAARLAELCGARVVPVAAGDGPINEGCGAVHPKRLAETVRLQGLDAGFAVDGDADRCVLVTADGDVVPGDALTWLLTRHMHLDALAVTVMSNAALEGLLPGVRVARTPVGDKHLQRIMAAEGIALGAEESGHVLFHDWPGGDGLLTGLRGLAAAFASADTLAEAVSPYSAFPRDLSKIRVAQRTPLSDVPGLSDQQAAWEQQLGSGRVFLRYSGTEPVLRILVEGPEDAVVQAVSTEAQAWLSEALA